MSIGNIKPSAVISYNNELYTVVGCQHVKLGRGSAFCRAKLRSLKTSRVLEFTLRDSDNIKEIFIEARELQYSYSDAGVCHFLDSQTYEDFTLDESAIKDVLVWLTDNLKLTGFFYNNQLINLELPSSLKLKIIETDPGFRGNTVRTGTKPAKLETGLIVSVPLFINSGDTIKVDTRTKEYLERA
ncbi:MAG: elongation factor P [Candidatus Omnitrophica bacterium]|nr:elongation factor P [Candidatus Omnitrophota bacterium]MBU0897231.1 elongation factor P [Candidatus Omnitrophota bacterium]MBU1134737.1 elongation factor P [Candidatus Omnitrophota bacterium]MBU1366739.1 elongation factor P [Candidatus Omnitrophota bacterium]MBU1524208.1 elongation factor P [Candidatus Omnitrophota bacterium]